MKKITLMSKQDKGFLIQTCGLISVLYIVYYPIYRIGNLLENINNLVEIEVLTSQHIKSPEKFKAYTKKMV